MRHRRTCRLACASVVGVCAAAVHAAAAPEADRPLMWRSGDDPRPDEYVAFRGTFQLDAEGEVEIRTLASGWFVAWLDGDYLTEGPARFHIQHPQYDTTRANLSAGRHVLAVQAHHIGVTTRMLVDMPPFLYCRVLQGGKELPVTWKCHKLGGYRPQVRRINPQLGWIEWCDTRGNPAGWRAPQFDDDKWSRPEAAKTKIGKLAPVTIGPVKHFVHPVEPMASGPLAERFGYEFDDVAARFALRDLACDKLPAQGVWRRYDLGRVRLGRPRFTLDLPAGAIVEFAYCEVLIDGRVSPYITLSAGASCNLDHYVARGGVQELFPLTPKGGRFLEIHIFADNERVKFIREEYIERSYHGPPLGSFTSGDALLDRIWMTGVETYRACAEDALIDNPTRERGQWTGDVASVGMDIAAAAWCDLRVCRRGLVQSALCAREDGLIAGLCPGGPAFLPSYSAQWVTACLHYYELTGDRTLLADMYGYAVKNIAALERFVTNDGLTDGAGWVFIDWGYVRNPGPADMAYNLHFLAALRSMARWCDVVGSTDDRAKYAKLAEQIGGVIDRWLRLHLDVGPDAWPRIGYHTAVLALASGLVPKDAESACVGFIKAHTLGCFPNNREAPRNASPSVASRRLITPYFAHYALPLLIERGEMDFVLDQYRSCWGWALKDGRTTWVEVFDTRWTHCHQWAGCPTWQLSRYVLGLHPRFDLGKNHFVLGLCPGSLSSAKGTVPLPRGSGGIDVAWTRTDDGFRYRLRTTKPIWLHLPAGATSDRASVVRIEGEHEMVLPIDRAFDAAGLRRPG